MSGPKLPIHMLQKMAGFARAAQCMYWKGVRQKVTGAIAAVQSAVAMEKSVGKGGGVSAIASD